MQYKEKFTKVTVLGAGGKMGSGILLLTAMEMHRLSREDPEERNTYQLNAIDVSEESLHDHPKFLKFNITLAKNICLVKKCLYAQFNEFFEELEINYDNLEGELEDLIGTTTFKKEQPKKQLEERLTT